MTDLEQFALTLAEVGPQFDEVSGDTWTVLFTGDVVVAVHFDAVGYFVSFTMPVGPVPEEGKQSLYATMLSYNFLKRDTGGFHLAIDRWRRR